MQTIEVTEDQKKKLDILNAFGDKFMAVKAFLLDLGLPETVNFSLAIQYLDDGFLRAREAIMAVAEVSQPV